MEGLNVADYAASDQVALPRELLCKLHVNRAACYFTMVSLPTFLPPYPPFLSPLLFTSSPAFTMTLHAPNLGLIPPLPPISLSFFFF